MGSTVRTLTSLRDDALAAVFARVPRASHDALRVCCKRLNRVGERRALARLRAAEGWGETSIVVAGGSAEAYNVEDGEAPRPDFEETWALVGGRWRPMAALPLPRCDSAAGLWRGRICVGGTMTRPGAESDDPDEMVMTVGVDEVVCFDAVEDRWQSLGPMPGEPGALEARSSGAAVVDPVSGALVVVGGEQVSRSGRVGVRNKPAMQALAPDLRAWERLAPLPHHVTECAAAVYGDRLYVAGGVLVEGGQRGTTDAFQVYDFRARTWSLGPPLPVRVWGARSAVLGGKLYVVGGQAIGDPNYGGTLVYDLEAETWVTGPNLPGLNLPNLDRLYHSVLMHEGRLFVIGGLTSDRCHTIVLNEAGDGWRLPLQHHVPSLPPPLDANLYGAMICSAPIG